MQSVDIKSTITCRIHIAQVKNCSVRKVRYLEMKSDSYMLGFACGLCFVVVFSLIVFFTQRKKGYNKYDEMQERARGIAYKYAFWAVIITEVIFGILSIDENLIPLSGMTRQFFVILVGVLVHVIYSVWHDAYIGLNTNVKRYTIICGLLAIVNLLSAARGIMNGNMFVDGKLDFPFVNLMVGVMFVVVSVEMFIKNRIESREE